MELDDFKKSWQDYDQRLAKNLKMNEALLKKMNVDKSKREMSKPLLYEVINLVAAFLVALYMIGFALRHQGEVSFIYMAALALAIDAVYFVLAILKLKQFYRIDYYNSTVVDLQKGLHQLKILILRSRKWEVGLVPLFMLGLFPVVFIDFRGIDLFQNVSLYMIEMGVGMAIAFVLIIWINRQVYDKKLKNTAHFLQEIEDFEQE